MALPHHYLIALISPSGRLGQFPFAFLAVVIAFAHLYIYAKLPHIPGANTWNAYSVTLLALVWCKFCIVSRRLHDTGSNGLIMVPVLIVAAISFTFVIDPSLLGPKHTMDPGLSALLQQGMRLPRALFIAVFLYCVRAGGETGPNGYGPEFGDEGDMSGAEAALDGKRATTMPVHTFKRIKADESGWGARKRPNGFGRR